jgi:DNA-binding transcriptional ArsR family regulator
VREIKHPQLEQIELTDLMHALSDPARVEIVRCMARERRPLTCSDLDLDRPKSSMSHHFKILRAAGLIETRIEGKEHLNTLRTAELEKKFPGLVKALLRVILES